MTRKMFSRILGAASALSLAWAFGTGAVLAQTTENDPVSITNIPFLDMPLETASEKSPYYGPVTGAGAAAGQNGSPKHLPDSIWHLAGYAQAGAFITNGDKNDSFMEGKFSPGFHFLYKEVIMFEAELEIETEDGETKVALEYSQLDWLVLDNTTLIFGKFLSPIGLFRERLHPGWINKLPSAPVGFGHGGVQPLSEIGFQVRGVMPLSSGEPFESARITYALMVGNGPRLGHGGIELEGFSDDDNRNKSFGGRVAFLPVPYLEFGFSYLGANVVGPEDHDTEENLVGNYDLIGFDASYTRSSFDIRFEFLDSRIRGLEDEDHLIAAVGRLVPLSVGPEEEAELLETNADWRAWYAQAAYRLDGISDHRIIKNLEPVIRYGRLRQSGNHELEEANENQLTLGLNYWLAPSAALKLAVQLRDFRDPDRADETIFQFQVVYGF